MKLVVDASVAIKWLSPEEDHEKALKVAAEHELIAPQQIHAECANIVWKKVRRGNSPRKKHKRPCFSSIRSHVRTVAMRSDAGS